MIPITLVYFSSGSYKAEPQFWRMLAVIALARPLLIALQEAFNLAFNAAHLLFQPDRSEFWVLSCKRSEI